MRGESTMFNIKINENVEKVLLSNEKIDKIVDEILTQTDTITTPVEIIPIVKSYGFSVYQADMPDSELGFIMVNKKIIDGYDSNKVIVFNENHPKRINRFIVARELAHYRFHYNECIYAHRNVRNISDVEEKNANNFASALLMPSKSVKTFVKDLKNKYGEEIPDGILIHEVANKFNVSESAAAVRLKRLKNRLYQINNKPNKT